MGYPLPAHVAANAQPNRFRLPEKCDVTCVFRLLDTRRNTPGPWNVDQRHEHTFEVDAGVKEKMATDYDAPRRSEADDLAEDSLEELKARRNETQSGVVDVDESDSAENFELPGADLSGLSGEDLTVRVVPKQADEFTCSVCFLVHHRSRLSEERNGQYICRDCA
jgi:Domain of unknown function (DUF4193)